MLAEKRLAREGLNNYVCSFWTCKGDLVHWRSSLQTSPTSRLNSSSSLSFEEWAYSQTTHIGQMTRSSGKSAYQGKPHIGSSETKDASCWFAVPRAPDCGCFSRPANPHISWYGAFPENSVTQNEPWRKDHRAQLGEVVSNSFLFSGSVHEGSSYAFHWLSCFHRFLRSSRVFPNFSPDIWT